MRSFSTVMFSYHTSTVCESGDAWKDATLRPSPLVRFLPTVTVIVFPKNRPSKHLWVYWEFYLLSLSISSLSFALFPIYSHF